MIGAILGWVAFLRVTRLDQELEDLRATVRELKSSQDQSAPPAPSPTPAPAVAASVVPPITIAPAPPRSAEPPPAPQVQNAADRWREPEPRRSVATPVWTHLTTYWMVWLGGISIALAGVFLVRFSIEQGLLGPAARVSLGVVLGAVLHGVAEWGRRRSRGHFQALAALAGGASVMLYAALLAADLLYDLVTPLVVFAALAVVSLVTLALTVWHGPVMFILGVAGAYAVPVLVDTGADQLGVLLLYSLLITSSALVLLQVVYRHWLWVSVVAGSLGWWVITLGVDDGTVARAFYLTALTWLFCAVPYRDPLLRRPEAAGESAFPARLDPRARNPRQAPLGAYLLLVCGAAALSVVADPELALAPWAWGPLAAMLLLVAGARRSLGWLPVVWLLLLGGAWLLARLQGGLPLTLQPFLGEERQGFLIHGAVMTAVYVGLTLYHRWQGDADQHWLRLAAFTPLFWLMLAYVLVADGVRSPNWAALTVALGVCYLGLAGLRFGAWTALRDRASVLRGEAVWLIIGAHLAYALAVAMWTREASLTLALAAQWVSLAWLIPRSGSVELGVLLKATVAVVVFRLTFNPWLLSYPDDVHWSLWTYGGATGLAVLAAYLLREVTALRRWFEVAIVHLLALTVWAETRYQLYEGDVFARRFELLEITIQGALWTVLSLIYHRRAQLSETLRPVYRLLARVLLGLGAAMLAFALGPFNPWWADTAIATRPLFNLLLGAYGLPVVLAALVYRFHEARFQRWAGATGALALFVFINLEIRHLWQGTVSLSLPTGNGELYTYTAAWLGLAVGCLLLGAMRAQPRIHQAGFALMMLVVGKIFLVDMSGLGGLLRVASFLGLGLCLLALAYLYQRFNLGDERVEPAQVERAPER